MRNIHVRNQEKLSNTMDIEDQGQTTWYFWQCPKLDMLQNRLGKYKE